MSYLRPLRLQPPSLKQTAQDSWLQHLINLIRENQIICRRRTSSIPNSSQQEITIKMDNYDEKQFLFNGKLIHIKSDELNTYLDKILPVSFQEECLHRGAQMLRKELFFYETFPLFLRVLWRLEFQHLDLPPITDSDNRISVLNFLACVYETSRNSNSIHSAKFRLFELPEIDIEESYLMKRILRNMSHLKVLVMWWAADDAMLNIIGSTCHQLESLDLWRSSSVTDLGVKMLLTNGSEDGKDDDKSPLCHTLLRLGVKETSITHIGCLIVVLRCTNLEVLNFSHTSVVKDFVKDIILVSESKVGFSLKTFFLPLQSSDGFSGIADAFPNLEDLGVWTSIAQLRHLEASSLPKLQSLLLGGLHSRSIFFDFVIKIGPQLSTLKLETILMDIPLETIGDNCVNLIELQITNGRLTINEHECNKAGKSYFANLKLLHLFLVHYVPSNTNSIENEADSSRRDTYKPSTALHCILRHVLNLEGLQVTGCPTLDDLALKEILDLNPLRKLRRFIMTDATLQQEPSGTSLNLNSQSVLRLFESCSQLQCIGDLRHWNISPTERREVSKKIQEKTGLKWISTASH